MSDKEKRKESEKERTKDSTNDLTNSLPDERDEENKVVTAIDYYEQQLLNFYTECDLQDKLEFSVFKQAKRYKYLNYEIDALRKLNEVVLRLKQ